jgi:hypothetical protein
MAREAVVAIHNVKVGEIVKQIVKPTIESGGDVKDVLVLLESVVAGVLLFAVKVGGDEKVLDVLTDGVRLRMAEIRLGDLPVAGQS